MLSAIARGGLPEIKVFGDNNNQVMNPNMAQKNGTIKKATVSGDFSCIGVAKGGIEPPTSGL